MDTHIAKKEKEEERRREERREEGGVEWNGVEGKNRIEGNKKGRRRSQRVDFAPSLRGTHYKVV